VLAILLLLWSERAHAAGKRIGVPKFDGKHEALVRKKVMQLLKAHGYELVRSHDVQETIGKIGGGLDSDDGLKTLAKELALAAIITGDVQPKHAKIVVHNGADGSVLGDASFSGANPRKLAAEVGRAFWRKLGADIGRGHVPTGAKKGQKASTATSPEDNEESGEAGAGDAGGEAAEEKSRDESGAGKEEAPPFPAKEVKPKQETPAPEESAPAAPSGLAWLDVELGGGVLNRSLTFNQNLTTNVFPYTLAAGPILVGSAVVYPLDPLVGGLVGNLGLEGEVQQGVGISSNLESGRGSLKSVVHDFAGGLRYRFPFAATDEVYVSGTVGEDAFTFSGANRPTLSIPDTIYHYVRPGVGLHLALGHGVSIRAAGGYRIITNKGGPQISETFFRHLAVAGADGDLTVGFALNDNFEVRAGVEWRRYWYAMHSVPGDTYVAGGAVDQSFAFTGRIAFLFGRVSPPPNGAAPEEPPAPPPPKAKGRALPHPSEGDEGGGDTDQ
jgi:hypothetical protein